MRSPIVSREVVFCEGSKHHSERVEIVRETPLTIMLNSRELVTVLTDGSAPEDLVVGYLHNDGLLGNADEVRRLAVDRKTGRIEVEIDLPPRLAEQAFGARVIASSGSKGSRFQQMLAEVRAGKLRIDGELRLPLALIYRCCASLAGTSETHKRSHGVHSGGLFDREGVVCFREDIGRHNVLDKLTGWVLRERRNPADLALFYTGRISSEMALKAGHLGAPILLSRAAPTEQAVELCSQMNITLVGGMRVQSCRVFTYPERVIF